MKVVENLHSALEIARGQIDLCTDFSHLLKLSKTTDSSFFKTYLKVLFLFVCTLFLPKEVERKLLLGDTC